jgi:putative flippase GtrA
MSAHWAERFWRDQRLRYLVVGGVNTVGGYAIGALLLYLLGKRVMTAAVLAYLINVTIAFLGYKWFVFRTRGNYVGEYVKVHVVYGPKEVVALAAFFVLVRSWGMNKYLGQFLVTAGTIILSYQGHKNFSFRKKAPAAQTATAAGGDPVPASPPPAE